MMQPRRSEPQAPCRGDAAERLMLVNLTTADVQDAADVESVIEAIRHHLP
jgi:hypothetical protein